MASQVIVLSDENDDDICEIVPSSDPPPIQQVNGEDRQQSRKKCFKCLNPECRSKLNLVRASLSARRYYGLLSYPNKTRICKLCLGTVKKYKLDIAKQLMSGVNILQEDISFQSKAVLLMDSDSDESDNGISSEESEYEYEVSEICPNSSSQNGCNSDYREIKDAVLNTIFKYDLKNHVIEGRKIVDEGLKNCENLLEKLNEDIKLTERRIHETRENFYKPFKVKEKVIVPLEIGPSDMFMNRKGQKTLVNPVLSSKENTLSCSQDIIVESPKKSDVQLPPRLPFFKTQPKVNDKVFVMCYTKLSKWFPGSITGISSDVDPVYTVDYIPEDSNEKVEKKVRGNNIAYINSWVSRIPLGERVIALDSFSDNSSYYVGVVAECLNAANKYRYLIFFDDGYAQYACHSDVRVVVSSPSPVWKDVICESQEFIKNYLESYPERPMLRLQKSDYVKTELDGEWWKGLILEVDCSLVKVKFISRKKIEWIYRGSTRLHPLFMQKIRRKIKSEFPNRLRQSTAPVCKSRHVIEYVQIQDDEDVPEETRPVEAVVQTNVLPPNMQPSSFSSLQSCSKNLEELQVSAHSLTTFISNTSHPSVGSSPDARALQPVYLDQCDSSTNIPTVWNNAYHLSQNACQTYQISHPLQNETILPHSHQHPRISFLPYPFDSVQQSLHNVAMTNSHQLSSFNADQRPYVNTHCYSVNNYQESSLLTASSHTHLKYTQSQAVTLPSPSLVPLATFNPQSSNVSSCSSNCIQPLADIQNESINSTQSGANTLPSDYILSPLNSNQLQPENEALPNYQSQNHSSSNEQRIKSDHISNENGSKKRAVARKSTSSVRRKRHCSNDQTAVTSFSPVLIHSFSRHEGTNVEGTRTNHLLEGVGNPDKGYMKGRKVSKSRSTIFTPHDCTKACIRRREVDVINNKHNSFLMKPILLDFRRRICRSKVTSGPRIKVMYVAPCGRRLRSYQDVMAFLEVSQSILEIDFFCFDHKVNLMRWWAPDIRNIYIPDITNNMESSLISCVNSVDFSQPNLVTYSNVRIPTENVRMNLNPEFLVCCSCDDNCADASRCECRQLTLEAAHSTSDKSSWDFTIGYKYRRLEEKIMSGIFECNVKCACRTGCLNRVVQHPIRQRLQLFKTVEKGWGVRTLADIPKGSFICVYVGVLITEKQADEDCFDDYLADLDFIETFENEKFGYESDVSDIEREDEEANLDALDESNELSDDSSPKQSDSRFSSRKGKSSRYELDKPYTAPMGKSAISESRSMPLRNSRRKVNDCDESDSSEPPNNPTLDKSTERRMQTLEPDEACATSAYAFKKREKSLRSHYNSDESTFVMDSKATGNIGRYMNHSCDPNIFVQNVFVDTHDLRFPWVSFFSLRNIKAGDELTWDYNYEVGTLDGRCKLCFCKSKNCRGRLL